MTTTTANLQPTEMRFQVDADEAPLCYPDGHLDPENLAVEVAAPTVLATLVVPVEKAREWAGELFGAISVAYRELTGDAHALSDGEITGLRKAVHGHLGGVLVTGDGPAQRGAASRFPSTFSAPVSAPAGCERRS